MAPPDKTRKRKKAKDKLWQPETRSGQLSQNSVPTHGLGLDESLSELELANYNAIDRHYNPDDPLRPTKRQRASNELDTAVTPEKARSNFRPLQDTHDSSLAPGFPTPSAHPDQRPVHSEYPNLSPLWPAPGDFPDFSPFASAVPTPIAPKLWRQVFRAIVTNYATSTDGAPPQKPLAMCTTLSTVKPSGQVLDDVPSIQAELESKEKLRIQASEKYRSTTGAASILEHLLSENDRCLRTSEAQRASHEKALTTYESVLVLLDTLDTQPGTEVTAALVPWMDREKHGLRKQEERCQDLQRARKSWEAGLSVCSKEQIRRSRHLDAAKASIEDLMQRLRAVKERYQKSVERTRAEEEREQAEYKREQERLQAEREGYEESVESAEQLILEWTRKNKLRATSIDEGPNEEHQDLTEFLDAYNQPYT
ncbi:MAG: hypothetical protein LQ349_005072 [Xanthoria aureola]|nr:MAG: hypothetical protein LQ349_005072 [Xanthoria aureola]